MVASLLFVFGCFILGLFVGSFLNLLSDRLVFDKPIILDRSCCEFCHTALKPLDLIPLFSFLFLKGHCKYCKKSLSWYYPLSELLTGSCFAFCAWFFKLSIFSDFITITSFIIFLFIVSTFIALVLTDLKHFILPDQLIVSGILFCILFYAFEFCSFYFFTYNSLVNNDFGVYLLQAGYLNNAVKNVLWQHAYTLLSTFVIWLFFIFLIVITKGKGMGGGDAKLAILIGIFNGFYLNFVAIFLGFVFGAAYSLVLIALKKTSVKDVIPFGPFLILGSLVAYFYGNILLGWYWGLF